MLLLSLLFNCINALDMDVPMDAKFDIMSDDPLYETDTFSFRYTHHLTAPLDIQRTKRVMVSLNCMVYWITV